MFNNYIIYGLGISGIATAKYLLRQNKKVVLTDDNQSAIENVKEKLAAEITRNNSQIKFLSSDEIEKECSINTAIIFSPGIPLYHPKQHKILQITAKTKAHLMCDVELFYLLNNHKKFLAITGTNGKSTSTALVGFIFEQLGLNIKIGGNIGISCFDLPDADAYVFETSSYQLDLINKTHFCVSALTNITPDHIDRHGSFLGYINAKKRVFKNQTKSDFAIVGIDNENSKKLFDDLQNDKNFAAKLIAISTKKIFDNSVSVVGGVLHNRINGKKSDLSLQGAFLRGEHNMENIAVAFATVYCYLLNCNLAEKFSEQQIVDAIKKFKGLRHRMQPLGEVEGINFVNDSKATNAESTENALKSYDHIFWILGGKPKEGGITSLTKYFNKIVKAYLIGEASDDFAQILQENGVNFVKCGDLRNAFAQSFFDAKNSGLKEKNIILSPACASFDQWKNFEERGDYFCKAFAEIFDETNKIQKTIINS